jgi:hypothetical protein
MQKKLETFDCLQLLYQWKFLSLLALAEKTLGLD